MDVDKILAACDHTLLHQDATFDDIRALCDDAIKYGTASVCIPPSFVGLAKDYVGDSLRICTVIGFPNGYSISRTPSGQYSSAGRAVTLAEAQPGDIICYGNGGCSHVALYIGNGQIVQESNPRRGLEVNSVYFMSNIIGVKNVID